MKLLYEVFGLPPLPVNPEDRERGPIDTTSASHKTPTPRRTPLAGNTD
jgi:hypothetical protein